MSHHNVNTLYQDGVKYCVTYYHNVYNNNTHINDTPLLCNSALWEATRAWSESKLSCRNMTLTIECRGFADDVCYLYLFARHNRKVNQPAKGASDKSGLQACFEKTNFMTNSRPSSQRAGCRAGNIKAGKNIEVLDWRESSHRVNNRQDGIDIPLNQWGLQQTPSAIQHEDEILLLSR